MTIENEKTYHIINMIAKKIRMMLSHLLYFIGDAVSRLLYVDCLSGIFYPIYTKCMIWSSDLDEDGEIWIYTKRKNDN